MKSQLSVETLRHIWDLSDVDNDGNLDKYEFILAMHLVNRCVEGDMLPDALPQNLVPPGKEQYFTQFSFTTPSVDPFVPLSTQTNMALVPVQKSGWPEFSAVPAASQVSPLALVSQPYTTNNVLPQPTGWPQFGPSQSSTYPPWAISAEELAKSNRVFSSVDLDADGLLSGAEVRDVLMRSGLQQTILAQIWDLVDIQSSGMLNCEQFAVAMHLATEQLSSSPYNRNLPTVLPPALFPPSLRPVPPSPAMFEESNKLIAEVEAINRERAEVEAAYSTLALDSQRRATEIAGIQRNLDTLSHTSRSFVSQRSEAERRLSVYDQERSGLETTLKELKAHVSTERSKVEDIRNQVNSQQSSAKNQEETISRLRTELNELMREESMLRDRVAENRRRLEMIETENRTTQTRIEKTSSQVTSLESTRGQLLEVLDQYTKLLNGEVSAVQPDELKIKALLNGSSLDASVASFDTGLGGSTGVPTGSNAIGEIDWSSSGGLQQRVFGAASVPLSVMSATPLAALSDKQFDREHPVSSLDVPLNSDPFLGTDLFSPDPVVKVVAKDDLFGPTSLFSTSDPFKGVDPFGTDPFSLPVEKPQESHPSFASAFDPFSCPVDRPAATFPNSLTGADFDAVFGSADAPVSSNDPFGADPFSSLQLANSSGKKSPPPRPKTQPGAGRAGHERNSVGDAPDFAPNLTSHQSMGSLPDFTAPLNHSKFPSLPSSRTIGHGAGSNKLGLLSRVRTKSKREGSSDGSGPTKSKSNIKSGDSPEGTTTALSEAEQLYLATVESQRLAKLDERARQQEEADLELAIRLSQLDTTSPA